jgi:phosphatidylglycerophosphate synthase
MANSYKNEFQAVWDAMKPDIFTTRLFFDPLAVPLTILFSRVSWISANLVTFLALIPGLVGACFFASGQFVWGAVSYYIFFLLDSIDGKLARLLGAGDPLGAFYDFVVDRIVIGLMLLGMGFSFTQEGLVIEFAASQLFLLMFFLKDVLDLKWKESAVPQVAQKEIFASRAGFLSHYKIHFKPGQLLSCFIIFLIGPLTNAYLLSICLAIAFVAFSMANNVLLPWLNHIRSRG